MIVLSLALGGCAQQDAALFVTFSGSWRIPQDGDTLSVDVVDLATNQTIAHKPYKLTGALPVTLTVVESGAQHAKVRVRGSLQITTGASIGTTALGQADATFSSGATVDVAVTLVAPQ